MLDVLKELSNDALTILKTTFALNPNVVSESNIFLFLFYKVNINLPQFFRIQLAEV